MSPAEKTKLVREPKFEEKNPAESSCSQLFDLRSTKGQILFLVITVLTSCLIQYLPKSLLPARDLFAPKPQPTPNCTNAIPAAVESLNRLKYSVYGMSRNDDHLRHVHAVIQRLGFDRIDIDDDWDLLWAHDYPFQVHAQKMKNLRPHQKVNHFPGCGYITNKLELSTTDLPFIPRSFKLPLNKAEFIQYSGQHPEKLFVQKHNEHRHIHIRSATEIDFSSNETFIQEFIDNPYLVDGYKFDVGVYVIITSIDPLRVYIYKGDILFRYCPVQYHPFDASNVDKYIVGDDYLPTWEVPSLSAYYNDLGFGMKDSFDAYVRSRNQNPETIWNQVEDAIRTIILEKEKYIIDILKNYKSERNFFEMIRFDLIIDDRLNAHLMEANMSPNLSSAHFKPNTLLYEQVLYSLMNLVGIGSPVQRNSLKRKTSNVEAMISSDKNIVVDAELCTQSPCTESCSKIECQLCKSCLSQDHINTLHTTYREHMHRIDTKRIFPVPIQNITSYDIEKSTENLSPSNKLISRWFYGKCKMDSSWCT